MGQIYQSVFRPYRLTSDYKIYIRDKIYMRVVFLTIEEFAADPSYEPANEPFRFIFANVAASFPDVHIVTARRPPRVEKKSFAWVYQKARKVVWRARRFGVLHTLELETSRPLQRLIGRRNWQEVEGKLRALPQPPIEPQPEKAV
jgi:hypothetical protein